MPADKNTDLTKKKKKVPNNFVVENEFVPTIEEKAPPLPKVPLPKGREPLTPGVPPQSGKARFISAEMWVLIRAVVEGRRFSIAGTSDLTGVAFDSIKSRADREGWSTPERVKAANGKKIDEVVTGIFDNMADYIKCNGRPELLGTMGQLNTPGKMLAEERAAGESGEVVQHERAAIDNSGATGTDLRQYLEMPAEFKPGPLEWMGQPKPQTQQERIDLLKRMAGDTKSELARKADIHQLATAEIVQMATLHLLEKMQDDPALGLLMSTQLEKLNKVGRANLRLDENKELRGATNVLIMSDPTFIPKPAIMLDAELVDETPDEDFPQPSEITQDL